MAVPPEPLAELLARADLIVVAEVTAIVRQGPTPASPPLPKGKLTHSGRALLEAAQLVELRVVEVLRGAAEETLRARKPEAPYLLAIGVRGAFLLAGDEILGRYGPEPYSRDEVVAALARARRS